MSKKHSFINQFIKDSKMVGSVYPSSSYLMDKMLENVDFGNSKTIVELGPGTGVFTFEILKRMRPDAVLLVFELNQRFMRALKKEIKDKRVVFVFDSAEKMKEYLEKNGLENADTIISSLPLSNFNTELREKIIRCSFDILKSEGKFIQFQYSIQSKKMLESIFGEVDVTFTPFNFPPAFVYTCTKK